MLMVIRKKKRVILKDKRRIGFKFGRRHLGLDVKGNKAIKNKFVFLVNRLIFPKTVTYS